MNNFIEELYSIVESDCKAESNLDGYGIWSHHIKPMVLIAKNLAKEYGADDEIVTLAALLHDLAGIRDRSKRENHHLFGAELAGTILSTYEYPQEKIRIIQKCILNHRGSINNIKDSIEEICIADADAIAHIHEISSLFYLVYKEQNLGIDEGVAWIKGKLERDWNKLSEQGKLKFKNRYTQILEVLT